MIIQKGIKRVVATPNNTGRWEENFKTARENFKEVGMRFDIIENPPVWCFGNV
jgi:hypothetical protein